MKVIGFAVWSDAGKTHLLRLLLPSLFARGFTVSTIKHAHHTFDVDVPGKDSFKLRQAGAKQVLVSSGKRFALMHEYKQEQEWGLPDLLRQLSPVDFVLIEGFKRWNHPKIEVHRQESGKEFLFPQDPNIVAILSDQLSKKLPIPQIDPDDVETVCEYVMKHAIELKQLLPLLHERK
jgi:molybdopterin-guanine dinucleotide biosynthesis protein B